MDGKHGIEAMRVEDSETCAKMTEERSKNGVTDIATGKKKSLGGNDVEGTSSNGALSPKLTNLENNDVLRPPGGGRLKFFKDGKLIIELSHRKDGERQSWVQVPKKTFWPPPGGGGGSLLPSAAAGSSRQESSASLSVSDDNSSVQSSPWQRDHCWKQQTPRRDLNKELAFLMQPTPSTRWLRRAHKTVRKKRRKPLDSCEVILVKSENASTNVALPVIARTRANTNNGKLKLIIERLINIAVETNKQAVPSCNKLDPNIVSPRKRILREFERVSLEDQASKRHKRPSALVKSPSPPSVPGCSNNNNNHIRSATAIKTKGNYNVPSSTPSPPAVVISGKSIKTEKLGSYSINSLLGKSDSESSVNNEPSFLRCLLKSPSRTSDLASVAGSSSPSSVVHSPQPCQSPPEMKWHSRPPKKKHTSPDGHLRLTPSSIPPPPPPPVSHLSPPPHFLSPPQPHMYHNLNYLTPQTTMLSHYYSTYAHPSRMWPAHPSIATASLHYPGHLPMTWPPMGPPTQQPVLIEPKEELAADMPLNLSKNAG